MRQNSRAFRAGRSAWAALVFMAGFFLLLMLVTNLYLLPAMQAIPEATEAERRQLSAQSLLLLAVVLFILLAGLVLTFRVSRFFRPRRREPRVRTSYIDAWEESGRRTPPPDDEQEQAKRS